MKLKQRVCISLEPFYCVSDGDSFVTAVYKRLSSIALCKTVEQEHESVHATPWFACVYSLQ